MRGTDSTPVIVIPAHNEGGFLGKALSLIKETGIPVTILVIDDGSKDRTLDVARRAGVFVKRFNRNRGKANAFFAGLREALRMSPSAVITLDADLTQLPTHALKSMILRAEARTMLGESFMVVAKHREGWMWGETHAELSGFRSFSIPAVHQILRSKLKSRVKGYGLETFLEAFFPPSAKCVLARTGIRSRTMYRGDNSIKRKQIHQIIETKHRLLRALRGGKHRWRMGPIT